VATKFTEFLVKPRNTLTATTTAAAAIMATIATTAKQRIIARVLPY
jgi:hypothetical protein